jgi:hypothetical protein
MSTALHLEINTARSSLRLQTIINSRWIKDVSVKDKNNKIAM